jgi:CRP/FNR family cyclic AMP-dependent transcriptional regulator
VVCQFPKNVVLINEGDHGDSLFIVVSGKVKVFASNAAGRDVVIDFHGPGEYVGEMALDGGPRSASVVTVEPTTCAVVSRAQFRDFVLAHPDFALHLIER